MMTSQHFLTLAIEVIASGFIAVMFLDLGDRISGDIFGRFPCLGIW